VIRIYTRIDKTSRRERYRRSPRRMAERRRIHIGWGDFLETPVQANAHVADQLTRVLLENAPRYTPEGGTPP